MLISLLVGYLFIVKPQTLKGLQRMSRKGLVHQADTNHKHGVKFDSGTEQLF